MISNELHPSELHKAQSEQKVNKQIERYLLMRNEYQDDIHDDLDDQNYLRHPTIRKTQNP